MTTGLAMRMQLELAALLYARPSISYFCARKRSSICEHMNRSIWQS